MPPFPSYIEEIRSAARGSMALIMGDRAAPRYFDFSLRGLYGSIIAFLAATAFNVYFPALLGFHGQSGSLTRTIILVIVLYALQIAFGAVVLRQLNRLDGLVPYLVADNWVTFFVTILSTGLLLVGLPGDAAVIGIGILILVIEINIARLIVTLAPLQIAMFLIAQLVGVFIGIFVVSVVFPLPPELLAELARATAGQ